METKKVFTWRNKKATMKSLIVPFTLGLVLLGFADLAAAQSLTTGAIAGTVMDESGAVMVSVVVTAKNVDTDATRETQTTGGGHLVLDQLRPRRYGVRARPARSQQRKT